MVNASVVNNITCHNVNDGSIIVTVSGGTAPFQYSLDGVNFQEEATFADLAASTYLVTVRDAAGFLRSTNTLLITNPPVLTSVVTVEGATITVVATGGTGTLTYSINGMDFQSSPVFPNLADGIYQVSVRDANGCAVVTTVLVVVNNLLANAEIIAPISCFGAEDGSIQVMVNGGIAPFRFSLNGGPFQADSLFTGLGTGNYAIVVEDAGGASFNANTIVLTEPGMLVVDLSVLQDSIVATASGGSSPYTYSLDGVVYQASPVFYDLANGDYEVWVQDTEGCTVSQQTSILVGLLAVPKPDLQFTLYPNPTTGQFQVTLRPTTGRVLQCDIYNATGQLVLRRQFAQAPTYWQAEFDLSTYPAGMYEVVVTDGQLWGVKRIIVE
ncbi:MAG: hypothetical protein DA408_11490 [Bacteroidetes bacterium]|nr:MAG: hypothetical protein C7N36_13530 [Bacteroidota bacterium]PTM12204.1 MAG: hypothetical protein DA408_11490 [Bacteroidota bacterium]